jgi:hypothetical protein
MLLASRLLMPRPVHQPRLRLPKARETWIGIEPASLVLQPRLRANQCQFECVATITASAGSPPNIRSHCTFTHGLPRTVNENSSAEEMRPVVTMVYPAPGATTCLCQQACARLWQTRTHKGSTLPGDPTSTAGERWKVDRSTACSVEITLSLGRSQADVASAATVNDFRPKAATHRRTSTPIGWASPNP